MKFIKAALILSFIGVFVAACTETKINNTAKVPANASNTTVGATGQPTATTVDELAAAKTIYLETCVGCHRENGEGGESQFEGRKIKVPSYKSKGAMNASDDKLYNYIANGEEGEMPAFKDKLTVEQMKTLVKFIRREFQNK